MVSITLPPINPIETPLQKRIKAQANEINVDELPESYKTNTSEEISILDFAENFRKQYSSFNPQRVDLLLVPQNECGIGKFISTFIRPTKLPFKQLFDVEGCAKFVADYITYEPLVEPTKIPQMIQSPSSTLTWQAGNSFDISTLLASLLIGVGYDALCVSGYAHKRVTMNDQTSLVCPFLSESQNTTVAAEGEEPTAYDKLIIPKYSLESKYLKAQDVPEEELPKSNLKANKEDALSGRRVHCWILVLPNKRDVEKAFFIEPSNGEIYFLNGANLHEFYISIESIWNNTNYWVNLQEVGIKEISFALNDLAKWEYMFLDSKTKEDANNQDIQALEVPSSWAAKIELSKEQFETQYPGCQKTILFKNSKLELFTPYSREDGMIQRIHIFQDEVWNSLSELREYYKNRKDLLLQRNTLIKEDKVHEMFAPGRSYELKDIITIKGKKRELHFYSSNRSDGLVRKEFIFEKKVMEFYEPRDDNKLLYRSATFDTNGTDDLTRISDGERTYPILKMTQKYTRSPEIPADKDIQRISFFLEQRKIEIGFHRDSNKIIPATRTYTRDGKAKGFQADVFAQKPTQQELFDDFTEISQLEKDCVQKLKDSDREAIEIVESRENEEKKIELYYSVYDAKKNKSRMDEKKEEKAEVDLSPKDLLAVFLSAALDGGKKGMNSEIAKTVVENTLKAYKERLSQKEKLIQIRLEKETKQLKKKQAQLSKNQDLTKEEEEEHQRYIADASFRKKILEQRLHRQQNLGPELFEKFEKRVRSDHRIAPFLK